MSHPVYPQSEIVCLPVCPVVDTSAYKGRRHTHEDTSTSACANLISSAPNSRSSVGSCSISPEPEKQKEDFFDDTFKDDVTFDDREGNNETDDRRPSFAEMQSEDHIRRPSVTVYQSEDPDHPDIKSIQQLVANMTFGD